MTDERLIVALDFHTLGDVQQLVEELGDSVNFYKVGMELFYSVSSISSSTTFRTPLRAVYVR